MGGIINQKIQIKAIQIPKLLDKKTTEEETEKYSEYSKIINAIQNNIGKQKLFICFNIKAYEKSHDILTEFAWCMFTKDGTIVKKKYAIVREAMNYYENDNIPDNRHDYLFGNTKIQSLKSIEEELKNDIIKINYIVCQSISNDFCYLNSLNIDISKFKKMTNSKIPEFGIIDMMDIYSGLYYTPGVSLEESLIKLKIPYEKLQNTNKNYKFISTVEYIYNLNLNYIYIFNFFFFLIIIN